MGSLRTHGFKNMLPFDYNNLDCNSKMYNTNTKSNCYTSQIGYMIACQTPLPLKTKAKSPQDSLIFLFQLNHLYRKYVSPMANGIFVNFMICHKMF